MEEIWSLRGVQQSSTTTTVTLLQSLDMWSRKNGSRGVKHGPSERQKMAKQMLKKARQGKQGRHPTILSRWYADEEHRKPSSAVGWKEHHIMLCDSVAVGKHIFIATRAESIQNSKHWILTINAEGGTQQSLSQRPDFAQAKRGCKRLHDEHLARTQEEYRAIPSSQQIRQRKGQQFEGHEEYDYAADPKTGWRFYKGSRANLQTASSSSSTWDQTHWKTSNWNSQHSSRSDDVIILRVRTSFGCLERNLQPTDGVCQQYTHKYSTYRVAQHDHISSREHAWLKIAHLCVPK